VLLVDTNVLAYLLIEGDRTPAAQALYKRDPDWRSEAFILVEFSNVLATYVRTRALTVEQGLELLARAQSIMPSLANASHAHALETAVQLRISAYDGRFISVAKELGTKLITEDAKLRTTAPRWTRSIDEALR
jgi:predicted nucleic acid-binding protein